MALHDIQQRRNSRQLAAVLVLLLVAQMLFPMQLHTRLVQDSNGIPIVICTIEGERLQYLDLTGGDQATLIDQLPSAAMQFSDLLTQASHDVPVISFRRIALFGVVELPKGAVDPSLPVITHNLIRGPPLA